VAALAVAAIGVEGDAGQVPVEGDDFYILARDEIFGSRGRHPFAERQDDLSFEQVDARQGS